MSTLRRLLNAKFTTDSQSHYHQWPVIVSVMRPVLNGRSRKMAARIAELEDQAEQARLRAAKFEKDKMKLQVEIRDISVELEAVNTTLFLRFHFLTVSYFIHSFILPRMYKDDNNSKQTVGHDIKATRDALITARVN